METNDYPLLRTERPTFLKVFLKNAFNQVAIALFCLSACRVIGPTVSVLYRLSLRSHRSIHASDGPQKLLKVIKNPVSDHFPPGCRKLCTSFKADRCVNAKELVPKPEAGAADIPVVIVVGAMAHGSLNISYTEEDVAISGYPLSAALACAKVCSAFEEAWDVL